MDVNELIGTAWRAVQEAEIPEPLQGLAFRAAVEFLSAQPSSDVGVAAAVSALSHTRVVSGASTVLRGVLRFDSG